jgi:hypothetical protein
MKKQELEEVEKLKSEVDYSNKISAAADEKLNVIDSKIGYIFSRFPNLLDDR